MKRIPVSSSRMKSIGFEDGVMEIEFPTGGVYTYHGPKVKEHYDGLMAAQSKGSYFNKHVCKCPHTTYKLLPAATNAQSAESAPQVSPGGLGIIR